MSDVLVPKSIKIAGLDYQVIFCERDVELDANLNYGECSNQLRRIKVSSFAGQQVANKVFIHELLEALNYIYLDNQLAHEQIQRLSFGLHQITEQLGLSFSQGEVENE